VIEVCTDRMSEGDLMETRCLLRLYQIFLLQILILLQVTLDFSHSLGLDQVNVDFLSLCWVQT
jgi:hypothetical protein